MQWHAEAGRRGREFALVVSAPGEHQCGTAAERERCGAHLPDGRLQDAVRPQDENDQRSPTGQQAEHEAAREQQCPEASLTARNQLVFFYLSFRSCFPLKLLSSFKKKKLINFPIIYLISRDGKKCW